MLSLTKHYRFSVDRENINYIQCLCVSCVYVCAVEVMCGGVRVARCYIGGRIVPGRSATIADHIAPSIDGAMA